MTQPDPFILAQMAFDDGFDAAKVKALEVLEKYILSPYNIKEDTLYHIKKELEKINGKT